MTITLKNEKYAVVKYNKKTKAVYCKCGGQVMINGEATYRMPFGVGFHPDGKFYSDYTEFKGYFGECMKCYKKIFAYGSKKAVSKRMKI